MSSVTQRIAQVKQPRGGYIKPSEFTVEQLDDGISLNEAENIHPSITGMVVDYLTRFMNGFDKEKAFSISLLGAKEANKSGIKNANKIAQKLLDDISGLDDTSIINACKLTTFDVWFRNKAAALLSKGYQEINPDKQTVDNIRTMVNRGLVFFNKYGPIVEDGIAFQPENPNEDEYVKMLVTKKGTYGGYTATVDTGDGDFVTIDTLWDFKVSVSEPTNKHTLQLLIYWIMGQHSGQKIYKTITKIGIFNPRLNKVYLLNVSKVDKAIIESVEKEVICY